MSYEFLLVSSGRARAHTSCTYVGARSRTQRHTYVYISTASVFESDYGTMARDGSAVVSAPPAKRTWRISFPGPLGGGLAEEGALSL